MAYEFINYNSKYVEDELDLRLRELTQQGLIKSEEEYKKVIENLIKTSENNLNRVTIANKYIVKRGDFVSSKQLNELFRDLEADIRILFKELNDINKVIDISLERNKLFYRRMKNRISTMWKELQKFRETSFNSESGEYIFFESFSEDSGMILSGLSIDKKTGTLTINPVYINNFNDTSDIKSVNVTLYPSPNKEGGVINTTHPNNKFEKDEDKIILKEGLWKVQLITSDIPEIILDIFNNKSYKGIVAYLDIEFNGEKYINHIEIDPYGDFITKILGVKYTKLNDSEWYTITDNDNNQVSAVDDDWIVLRNFKPITTNKIRIVFLQDNFQLLSKLLNNVDESVEKMVKSLIEKQLNKINYVYKDKDQFPKVDKTNESDIYDEVMNVIESGNSLPELEGQIRDILIPKPIEVDFDISNWKIFNLGAWSISPKNVGYNNSTGTYISHDLRNENSGFKINRGCPTYLKLYTKQEEPVATNIEWYILAGIDKDNFVEIPIIPNNDIYRTESIAFNNSKVLEYKTDRLKHKNMNSIIKLDFPIHPSYNKLITLIEDGVEYDDFNNGSFELYNSTELYIPDIYFKSGSSYAIKYIPALLDTVRCWVLSPNVFTNKLDIANFSLFANREQAQNFINILSEVDTLPTNLFKSDNYDIIPQLCTKQEYDMWFLNGEVGTFMDIALDDETTELKEWLDLIQEKNTSLTKISWILRTDGIKPYSENEEDRYTWNELSSSVPNIINKSKL